MNAEQASHEYWKAINTLQEIIDSGERGDKDELLAQIEDNLN